MSEILTISQNYKVDSNYSAVHTIRESRHLDPKLDSTLLYAFEIFTVFEKIGNNIYTDIYRHSQSALTHRWFIWFD